MAQAVLTKSLGNIDPMSTSRPFFTERDISPKNFLRILITTGKNAIHFSGDPTQLQYALKKLKDELINEKEKLLRAGTNEWETKKEGGLQQTLSRLREAHSFMEIEKLCISLY